MEERNNQYSETLEDVARVQLSSGQDGNEGFPELKQLRARLLVENEGKGREHAWRDLSLEIEHGWEAFLITLKTEPEGRGTPSHRLDFCCGLDLVLTVQELRVSRV